MNGVDTSIRVSNSMTSGEWVTVVIDMNKIDKIEESSSGAYAIKHCSIYTADLGAESVDIA